MKNWIEHEMGEMLKAQQDFESFLTRFEKLVEYKFDKNFVRTLYYSLNVVGGSLEFETTDYNKVEVSIFITFLMIKSDEVKVGYVGDKNLVSFIKDNIDVIFKKTFPTLNGVARINHGYLELVNGSKIISSNKTRSSQFRGYSLDLVLFEGSKDEFNGSEIYNYIAPTMCAQQGLTGMNKMIFLK